MKFSEALAICKKIVYNWGINFMTDALAVRDEIWCVHGCFQWKENGKKLEIA